MKNLHTDNSAPSADSLSQTPWYRHPWPWLLISVPAASMVLGGVMLTLAFKNPAVLVVDNYYAEGRAINRSIEQDQRALALNIQATLQMTDHDLIATARNTDAAALRLSVFHATDEGRDRHFVLLPDNTADTFSTGSATDLQALRDIFSSQGTWYFELKGETDDWRVRHRQSTPTTEVRF